MKPEPVPPASRGRCGAQIPASFARSRRSAISSSAASSSRVERGFVRVDVLLHERAHLGTALLDLRFDRELGHGVESFTVPLDSGAQVQNSIYLAGGAEWPITRGGLGGARAGDARAGAVRLHRRRRRLGGDDAREPGGVRASSPAPADARRQRRARSLRRGARPPLARAVPARADRRPLDRARGRRARRRARGPRDRRADDPLERRLELAGGRRRRARRLAALVPALLVRRSRARRQHRRPGRRGRLRRDRRHPRHAHARLAAARPRERLPALPSGRGAGAVLQRSGLPLAGSTSRRRTTCSRLRCVRCPSSRTSA